jgi:hypothetical protein
LASRREEALMSDRVEGVAAPWAEAIGSAIFIETGR